MNTFKVRDLRRKHFFTVDNEFIDRGTKELGSIASMIYILLCRSANENQEAFPSQEEIAEKLATTRQTVNEKIQLLASKNIITITHTVDEKTGEKLNNTYTLMDKMVWKLPMSAQTTRGNVGSDDTGQPQVHVGSDDIYSKTNSKTNIENFQENNSLDEWKASKARGAARKGRRLGSYTPFQYKPQQEFKKKGGVANGKGII